MAQKSRFEIAPELQDFGNQYVKTIDEKAILQGARFMDGQKNEIRLWYLVPATKTEKDKWGCVLLPFSEKSS